jgi:hypothetical protein
MGPSSQAPPTSPPPVVPWTLPLPPLPPQVVPALDLPPSIDLSPAKDVALTRRMAIPVRSTTWDLGDAWSSNYFHLMLFVC